MESTGNSREVPISVITAPPSPLPYSIVKQRCLTMFMLLYNMALGFSLQYEMIRMEFEGDKESPYKTHLVLMILAWAAFVISAISLCLMYTQKYLKNLRILEFTCASSGLLAVLCLFLVFCLPKHLVWVGYFLLSLVFVCCWFFPKENDVEACIQLEKISVNYFVMFFSLTSGLMLNLSDRFNPIMRWVLLGSIVFGLVYNTVGLIKSSNKKVQSVEACEVIQSNKRRA